MGACSTARTLDVAALETEIAAQVAQGRAGVDAVVCPVVEEPAAGTSFVCVAELGPMSVDVDVTLEAPAAADPASDDAAADDAAPDALVASAVVRERLVAADEVAALLASTFSSEVQITTSVDCGHPLVAVAPTASVRCTATDPSGLMRQFDVTVGDDGTLVLSLR